MYFFSSRMPAIPIIPSTHTIRSEPTFSSNEDPPPSYVSLFPSAPPPYEEFDSVSPSVPSILINMDRLIQPRRNAVTFMSEFGIEGALENYINKLEYLIKKTPHAIEDNEYINAIAFLKEKLGDVTLSIKKITQQPLTQNSRSLIKLIETINKKRVVLTKLVDTFNVSRIDLNHAYKKLAIYLVIGGIAEAIVIAAKYSFLLDGSLPTVFIFCILLVTLFLSTVKTCQIKTLHKRYHPNEVAAYADSNDKLQRILQRLKGDILKINDSIENNALNASQLQKLDKYLAFN